MLDDENSDLGEAAKAPETEGDEVANVPVVGGREVEDVEAPNENQEVMGVVNDRGDEIPDGRDCWRARIRSVQTRSFLKRGSICTSWTLPASISTWRGFCPTSRSVRK